MRQATMAKVCLDLAKSARFTVPVLSTAGFNRPLLALSTICRCPSRSRERSWPRNRGNLANVGLTQMMHHMADGCDATPMELNFFTGSVGTNLPPRCSANTTES